VVGLLGVFAVGFPGYFVFECDLAELLLLADHCGKERLAAGAGTVHRRVLRGDNSCIQRSAARVRCRSRNRTVVKLAISLLAVVAGGRHGTDATSIADHRNGSR
jgi:hypothetical protein